MGPIGSGEILGFKRSVRMRSWRTDLLKDENPNIQWMAAADWEDAPEYGPEYLLLRKGDIVTPLLPPSEMDPEDWAYGCNERSGVIGWYPPEYLIRKIG